MGITRVFSIMVSWSRRSRHPAGFHPHLGALVRSIPVSVQGGIEMYLFGLIAVIAARSGSTPKWTSRSGRISPSRPSR